ncbi:MAG: peptide chain release factor 2 [Peptococcaceae bacterium 1109]|jgi:peptide chain release factor 2|nr:MAG: peptide chain release factor 2 [Peptococcaceae bacterium 1109]
MAAPGFWDDQEAAQAVVKEISALKRAIQEWESVQEEYEDAEAMFELVSEEPDEALEEELAKAVDALEQAVGRLELASLLNGEYDSNNAIVSIHPGAGGTESQDWAEMLLRMYTRWADSRGYDVEVLDYQPGDEAGVKSVTMLVSGLNAYGYLKAEKGVHRLVRISPFDSSGRRHTSFTSVDVIPEISEDVDLEIKSEDLRIDTYRASGAGGQHVNKTESAVRITHIPTGIVVQCQSERSQHSNREAAMKILRSRLLEREFQEKQARLAELKGEQGEIAWGNQIRSYVFCPYTMVKDHRTNVEVGNVQAVMDGLIDPFIEAYLKMKR